MTTTLDRQATAFLLLQQADRFGAKISAGPAPYTFTVSLRGTSYTACVLARSSDYWSFRLHLYAKHVSLLVCAAHDSCVPLPVLSLHTGYLSAPYETPSWYSLDEPLTKVTSPVFLAQLLCGVQAAYERLERMKTQARSTYYRYLAKIKRHMQMKQGHPIKV
jgi:hypothetical protein